MAFDSNKEKITIFEPRKIPIGNAFVERTFGLVKPDVLIETEGKRLAVEIYVTHVVDHDKVRKYRNMRLSAIEIDLSELDRNNQSYDLAELVVNSIDNKKWIFNNFINDYDNELRKYAIFIAESKHGGYSCPLKIYHWKGVPSARWLDCLSCEFCYSVQPVMCMGESYISSLSDIHRPFEQRKKDWEIKRTIRVKELIEKGFCPQCGSGRLETRNGKFGRFKGCTNYPNCKYVYSGDK